MEKVNILHVVETLDIGGAESVVVDFVNHMPDRFHSTICCLKHSGPSASKITRGSVDIVELHKGEGNDYKIPGKIARLIKDRNIDILQSHNWATFCESAAAGFPAVGPVRVHLQHGESPATAGSFPAHLKRRIRRLAESYLAGRIDAIVAVSDQAKASLLNERSIDSRKVVVIRNGISMTEADPQAVQKKRQELGINKEDFVIVAVGRLAPVKNYPALIKSFSEVRKKAGRPVSLIIVGDGPERNSLQKLIEESGLERTARLLGARNDAREILSAGHVYVLPSLSEGISIALLEAMSVKLPAVATRVGGNGEVVVHGETGYLVEKNDVEAMSQSLLRFIGNEPERIRMGEAAWRRAADNFSLAATLGSFEKLYTTLLESKRRAA